MSEGGAPFRQAYEEQGYAVAEGLLPEALCVDVKLAFDAEVRPHEGRLRRQATMRLEAHNVSDGGFVTNAIIHAHDVPAERFPRFRLACRELLAHTPLLQRLALLLGAEPKLVQTIYFESGRGTGAHADSYFLDSVRVGSLVACWIALEDIHPTAGPFFIHPRSHHLGAAPDVQDAARFAAYEARAQALVHRYHRAPSLSSIREVTELQALLEQILEERGMARRSLPLRRGDVAFWSSLTVHGSDKPTDPRRSRRSLTAHFIAVADALLTHRLVETPLRLTRHRGLLMDEPGLHS